MDPNLLWIIIPVCFLGLIFGYACLACCCAVLTHGTRMQLTGSTPITPAGGYGRVKTIQVELTAPPASLLVGSCTSV